MLNYEELVLNNIDVEGLKKIKKIDTASLTIELYNGFIVQESIEDILLLLKCFERANIPKPLDQPIQ